ncbi:MAG: RluA family pseudouridine synthase [Planctomycetes bacterium]|nr:RluA family pseudouridine synthase [Planctomycetota bacterium]MBI3846384.1 RluA family pseudouridine synthase [Planctomycetota bacterium]
MQPIRFKVRPEDRGLRLDRFIAGRAKQLSRMAARRAIEVGGVYINRKRTKIVSRPVMPGETVEVFITPPATPARPPVVLQIAFEDDMVLVADKASGVPVQASRETDRGNLYEAIRDHLTKTEGRRPYVGLLHRIDQEVSGLVLFTKRKAANTSLSEQIRSHAMKRKYVTWVRGVPRITSATIREPIRGEAAVTHYQVVETRGPWARLEVELETGRTHQIRIHLAKAGHPILGDKRYGGPPARRIALHAREITFRHPASGEATTVRSELPKDFPAPPGPAPAQHRQGSPPTLA